MLWLHSFGVSIAPLSWRWKRPRPAEEALVAGLVHDVGKTVINNSIPDRYALFSYGPTRRDQLVEIENGPSGSTTARSTASWPQVETAVTLSTSSNTITWRPSGSRYQSSEMLCQLVAVADALCLKSESACRLFQRAGPMDVLGISPRLSMESPSGSVRDSSRSRRTCPDRLRRLNLC